MRQDDPEPGLPFGVVQAQADASILFTYAQNGPLPSAGIENPQARHVKLPWGDYLPPQHRTGDDSQCSASHSPQEAILALHRFQPAGEGFKVHALRPPAGKCSRAAQRSKQKYSLSTLTPGKEG